jgi:Fe-S cluster assembly protein SufD
MNAPLTQSSVVALAANDPAWLAAQRETAWRTFERLPLPSRLDMEWQRFDLRALKPDNVHAGNGTPFVVTQPTGLPPGVAAKGVIFCDLRTAIAQHGDLVRQYFGRSIPADEPAKFAALHGAFWNVGTFLYLPSGVRLTTPLEIPYIFSGQNAAGFPRTLIVLEPGAEATIVQKFTGTATGIHSSATEVFVNEGAHLHYVSFQNFSPDVFDFTFKRAHVARDAEIDWVIGMFGASFARYDIQCVMDGEGGTSFMYGAGVGDGRQQIGQFTRQHHRTGNTTSDLLFKNVLRDRSASNYDGIIKVEKNADGTNAYQSNRNLVLDKTVQCDTRPVLEIESNKLRCTHGATVGRLDENQLYYLRTRGLDDATARNVLIEAFLDPVLSRIQIESLRNEFAELIHRKVVR